ncbi:hypothetical protein [Rubripirellula reticaptiva]|uniref:Uncharacterized protein n=1 Tax=Rubripirellula reticaptiva TaxID=2528013 RepID=A0A5C6ER16_9BACT|nr:hypothetical protein [Rubripirellula reticaptiva]TWU49859.1 hypothetical protein Poly59_44840 [Rubripirellula reticaptiva]
MQRLFVLCLCFAATTAWSQTPHAETKKRPGTSMQPIYNPFDQPIDYGMGMEMGMDDMMGMDMGMGAEQKPSQDELFRANLPRAIQILKEAKTPENKSTLQGYIREAFEQRYDRMMSQRQKDIERLRNSLAELESDLKRRTAAKDRVVQLQLQSVQLAAEGLLQLDDLQGVGRGNEGNEGYGGGGEMGYGGMDGGMGFQSR